MKKRDFFVVCFVALLSTLILAAAGMQAPIVRGTPDTVSLVANFSDFAADSEYRIGVGFAGDGRAELEVALFEDDNPLSKKSEDFKQGSTQSWWSIEHVSAKGFHFAAGEVNGKEVTLKVKIPRAHADAAGSVYIFVAKKYGGNHWYLEDGAEVSNKYW